ncbi:MAG: hypothetical protein JHC93_04880 [Parachlamydiales bacterium]|nr:hypothetical protein [Parachlamydiales bacterium]
MSSSLRRSVTAIPVTASTLSPIPPPPLKTSDTIQQKNCCQLITSRLSGRSIAAWSFIFTGSTLVVVSVVFGKFFDRTKKEHSKNCDNAFMNDCLAYHDVNGHCKQLTGRCIELKDAMFSYEVLAVILLVLGLVMIVIGANIYNIDDEPQVLHQSRYRV